MITTIIIYRNIKNRRRWFLAFRPNTTGKYIRPFQMPVFFGKNISFTMYIHRIHREKATGSNCTLYYDYMSSEYPFMYLWYTAEDWYAEYIFLPIYSAKKRGSIHRCCTMLHYIVHNQNIPHDDVTDIFWKISFFPAVFTTSIPLFSFLSVYTVGVNTLGWHALKIPSKRLRRYNAQPQYELCILYM